jgi:hypothetical protein
VPGGVAHATRDPVESQIERLVAGQHEVGRDGRVALVHERGPDGQAAEPGSWLHGTCGGGGRAADAASLARGSSVAE